jgi:hypothetical protein
LAGVGFQLLLAARSGLGETWKGGKEEHRPLQNSDFSCPHVTIVRRASSGSALSVARKKKEKKDGWQMPPSLF